MITIIQGFPVSVSSFSLQTTELKLHQAGPASVAHTRSFSLALTQVQNNPLVRREEPPAPSGLCVTTARLVSKPLGCVLPHIQKRQSIFYNITYQLPLKFFCVRSSSFINTRKITSLISTL